MQSITLTACIYLITNRVTGKGYVGRSKRQQIREREHWRDLQKGNHHNAHLQRAFDQYGREAFCCSLLEYCLLADSPQREQWWIDLLGTTDRDKGYNLKGTGGLEIHSAETRAKMSAARKGKPSKKKGTTHSYGLKGAANPACRPEVRAKISATKMGVPNPAARLLLSGRTLPAEHRAKISASIMGNQYRKGIPHDEAARAKMSAAGKGRPWSAARRAAYEKRWPRE
jgi:group I intron endonuclease